MKFEKLSPYAPTGKLSDPQGNPQGTVDMLSTLLAENAELLAGYEEENAMLSAIMGGSAEAIDLQPEEREAIVSSVVQILDSVRREYDMSPRLFAFFIELCLEKRKFIIPVLAFAVCTQEADKARRLEQDEALTQELTRWVIQKLIPGSLGPPSNEPAEPFAKAAYHAQDTASVQDMASVQEMAQIALAAKPVAIPTAFTPTRCWRLTSGQYLLQGTAEPLPSGVTFIHLPNGELLYLAAPYYLVTAEGDVISTYPTPRCSSFEDTLFMTDIYAVKDGQLCKFFWQQQLDVEKVEAQVVNLPAFLRECECSELSFDPARIKELSARGYPLV